MVKSTTATDPQVGSPMLDREAFTKSSHVFNHMVPTKGVHQNSKSCGNRWLFAFLDLARQQLMVDFKLQESFELS